MLQERVLTHVLVPAEMMQQSGVIVEIRFEGEILQHKCAPNFPQASFR